MLLFCGFLAPRALTKGARNPGWNPAEPNRSILIQPPMMLRRNKHFASLSTWSMSTNQNNDNTQNVGVTTDDQTNAQERRARGEFVRGVSTARHWISDNGEFPVQTNRYHLIVAYNCPWCHRVLLGRAILGLEDAISVDVLYPNRSEADEPLGDGLWKFCAEGQVSRSVSFVKFPSCTAGDPVLGGRKYVKEIYQDAGISDQTSVPILYDKHTNRVVNNESAEILRMMETVLLPLAKRSSLDLYSVDQRTEIDALNDWIYKDISNGSYKAGFSTSQKVYEEAYHRFFCRARALGPTSSTSPSLLDRRHSIRSGRPPLSYSLSLRSCVRDALQAQSRELEGLSEFVEVDGSHDATRGYGIRFQSGVSTTLQARLLWSYRQRHCTHRAAWLSLLLHGKLRRSGSTAETVMRTRYIVVCAGCIIIFLFRA